MRRARAASALVVVAAIAGACGKSEPNEGRRMPRLAPHPGADLPKDLRIEVEISDQGQRRAGTAITAERLQAIAPDFADNERRAWRMESVIEIPAGRRALAYEVLGANKVQVELRASPDGHVTPGLLVSRRGDLVAVMLDPAAPFPQYHGQGGRLGRPNDEWPRVADVTRIGVILAP